VFCPQCEEEYSWDVMVCPVCDVDTVDKLPGPEPTPDAKLVEVFSTGDAGLIALAHSLLEGEKIDYFVRGDGLQDLFGLGRMTGFNYAMGPASFCVREEDADNARLLLQDLIDGKVSADR
jgi:putative signal transducing protein